MTKLSEKKLTNAEMARDIIRHLGLTHQVMVSTEKSAETVLWIIERGHHIGTIVFLPLSLSMKFRAYKGGVRIGITSKVFDTLEDAIRFVGLEPNEQSLARGA